MFFCLLIVYLVCFFKSSKQYKPRIFELKLGAEALKNELAVKRWDYNTFYSYYVIQLEDGLYFRKGRNYLVVFEKFQSVISNNLKGLYFSTYVTKNQTRWSKNLFILKKNSLMKNI